MLTEAHTWFNCKSKSNGDTVHPPSPNTGLFRFQSADRSAGRIYLRIQWSICYLPTLWFVDLDNESIANRSQWPASKRMRPHNKANKKSRFQQTENKHGFVKIIISSEKRKKCHLQWYKHLLFSKALSQRPCSQTISQSIPWISLGFPIFAVNRLALGNLVRKVGERSWRQPEGSLFNSFYTEVWEGCYSFPWNALLYPWFIPYNADC